jgi:hypothetical protein
VARSESGGVWLAHRGPNTRWIATRIGDEGQADQLLAAAAPPGAAGDHTRWLHVYIAKHGVIAQAEVALATARTEPAPTWTVFDASSSLRLGQAPPTALVVGPRASVLVGASDGSVAIVGIPSALSNLTSAS